MLSRLLLTVVAVQAICFAQIDRSPVPFPGGGAGGPWGTPRLPVPVPRGGGQGPARRTPSAESSTHATGKIEKIDEKSVVIQTEDGRTIQFQRTKDTRFYKESKEIKASELKAGDRVTVEATEDERGRLYARSVSLEAPEPAPPESASTSPRAEPPRDPDDPGPPVLRRGVPEKRETRKPEEGTTPTAESSPANPDAFLEKARAASLAFSEGLPDYVCKEIMSRFVSTSRPADWRAQDIVTMDIVYEKGRESYRNVAVDNKPTNKKVEELEGAWSTGEFASTLLDLLSPATDAEFQFRGQSAVSGIQARVYDFDVEQARSHWHVQAESQSMNPAYRGSLWLNPDSGRVLRIEIQARSLPKDFPFDTVESAVEYAMVRIGTKDFLLPAHAESLSCQRGTSNCSRNAIDFRNYHKFEAESSIEFGASNP